MTELNERFKSLDSLAFPGIGEPRRGGPDTGRGGRKLEPAPERRRRVAAGIVAFVVAVAGVGLVVVAFKGHRAPGSPRTSPPLVGNGLIWARVGGGDGPSFLSTIDPRTGTSRVLFNDGAWPAAPGAVTHIAIGSEYAWAPDGSRVAFSNYSGYGYEIFLLASDGRSFARLTHDGGLDAFPSWSPGGDQIVYASDTTPPTTPGSKGYYTPGCEVSLTECPQQIRVIRADGTGNHQLTHDPVGATMPDWSPDGGRIVFVGGAADPSGDIYVMDASGTGVHALTSGPSYDSFPQWSPDGTQIAFLRAGPGKPNELWIMNADGTGPHPVAGSGPQAGSFAWSPDGTQIAFATDTAGLSQVTLITPAGQVLKTITARPLGYGVGDLAWRPIPAPAPTPLPSAASPPGSGVSFAASPGWSTSAENRPAGETSATPVFLGSVWASNVAFNPGDLPARTGFPVLTLRSLAPRGIVLTVEAWTSKTPSDTLSLPLHLADFSVRRPEAEEPKGLAVYETHGKVNGQYLLVRIYFGAKTPTSGDLQVAQSELNTLQVAQSSSPPSSPAGASGTIRLFRGRTNDHFWSLFATSDGTTWDLKLVATDGSVLIERSGLLDGARPSLAASYTWQDPGGPVSVAFGLATGRVRALLVTTRIQDKGKKTFGNQTFGLAGALNPPGLPSDVRFYLQDFSGTITSILGVHRLPIGIPQR